MKENDVIVIGGGLSGIFAAITAARRGRKVLLVTKGVGAIAIGGGTIDMLGYDEAGIPVRSPWAAMEQLGQDHPYGLIGRDSVEQAAKAFLSLCAEGGYPYMGDLHENQWIPTALGRLKPSCLVPLTMNAAHLKAADDVAVVAVAGLKDYSGRIIADGLAQCPGYRKNYTVVTLKTGIEDGRDMTALDVARWLDTEQGRSSWCEQLSQLVRPQSVILLPPVLGTRPDYELFNQIEQATQCRVLETVGLPPAVTGYRLRKLLIKVMTSLGVRMIEQSNVIRATLAHGRCSEIVTGNLDRERSYRAQSFILASGGLFGGGLQATPGEVLETIFNLPVQVPAATEQWSQEHLFFTSGQPFAKFGVKVDAALRPVNETGNVLLENVFVAGKTLAGYDYCAEKSGNGVALATAYQAGLEA
jgi:glycerol-3-phosphate dehydrogenase subunit B